MSLRLRLNLLLGMLSLLILVIGAATIVHNAERSVQAEMRSTANLAIRLLEAALAGGGEDARGVEAALLEQLGRLEATRHLEVRISGQGTESWRVQTRGLPARPPVPAWFAGLVDPPPTVLRRSLAVPGLPAGELMVRARPIDEITEAWQEARTAFALLLLLSLLTLGVVTLAIGRALAPVGEVVAALDALSRGDYSARVASRRARPGGSELERIGSHVNELAETLERSVAQARDLARRSLDIQEQERRFLARELHDEMGQSLSAIRAIAFSLGREGAGRDRETAESARTIARVAGETYDTVRGMMHRLRPPALDELGLGRALQQLVTDWNARHAPAHCSLSADELGPALGDDADIHVYRIVQEALTNAARHAGAGVVRVALAAAGEGVLVIIADDGRGFDPERVRHGLGLVGMRERVNAMRGELAVDSAPGRGTRIRVRVPAGQEGEGR